MYKVIVTDNNGKRQVIDPFPTENLDLYGLARCLDKCKIKSFSVRLSDKEN